MNLGQQGEFTLEKRAASVKLLRVGPVVWGSATDGGGDVAVGQSETVAGGNGGRLGCESGLVESAVEEISGAVAGKHATGAVGTVRPRSQAD